MNLPIPDASGSAGESDRRAYYERIAGYSLAPLWETLHQLVTPEPVTPAVPHVWRFDRDIRDLIDAAGRLITAKEAERRVLILENPALPGRASITRSLYAGIQMVLPGEVAPAHRHTQSALRFVLQGGGAYTAVDGERIEMFPGDLVITPTWTWHDHGNESADPIIWLDALDIPLVQFLDTSFAQAGNADSQAVLRPSGDNGARYGANLLPVDMPAGRSSSPLLRYPYKDVRATLAQLAANAEPDACHGYKMRYANPATGDHVTPTIAAFIQLLPQGLATEPYKSTDGTVFVVVEGEGETEVGGEHFRWGPRDIFVVPSWHASRHRIAREAVLFSFSDRAAQQKLGLWREDRREPLDSGRRLL